MRLVFERGAARERRACFGCSNTSIDNQRLVALLSSGTLGAFTHYSTSSRLKNKRLFHILERGLRVALSSSWWELLEDTLCPPVLEIPILSTIPRTPLPLDETVLRQREHDCSVSGSN